MKECCIFSDFQSMLRFCNAVDVITGCQESDRNENIMVVVHMFTKMTHIIPTANRESVSVAKVFF
jgi:hypothetical protein